MLHIGEPFLLAVMDRLEWDAIPGTISLLFHSIVLPKSLTR